MHMYVHTPSAPATWVEPVHDASHEPSIDFLHTVKHSPLRQWQSLGASTAKERWPGGADGETEGGGSDGEAEGGDADGEAEGGGSDGGAEGGGADGEAEGGGSAGEAEGGESEPEPESELDWAHVFGPPPTSLSSESATSGEYITRLHTSVSSVSLSPRATTQAALHIALLHQLFFFKVLHSIAAVLFDSATFV